MKITLLNTSILTNYGTFEFSLISLAKAKELVKNNEIQSAIGHSATAEVLTQLLGVEIKNNRIEFNQALGEVALVFKLKARISEGKVLTSAEIEEIGYEFGILRRIK